MVKTKEYLKSRFETGDIPTGEDYENVFDSFWHKSELGQVADGDARPVSGDAVHDAIVAAISALDVRSMVQEILAEILPTLLADYVKTTALTAALEGNATQAWVNTQLADKLDQTTLNTAIAGLVTSEALATALAAKVDTTAMTEALSAKANTSDVNAALLDKADASAVYSKQQIDGLVASRPTHVEIAGTIASDVNDLKGRMSTAEGKVSTLEGAVGNSSNGLLHDVDALKTTVGGQQSGLVSEVASIQTKLGNVAENVSITADIKETRQKTNEMIQSLKADNLLSGVSELGIAV